MARHYIWFGSKAGGNFVDATAVPSASDVKVFPDVDTFRGAPGKFYYDEREVQDPRALALAPETDIDLVRVFIGDDVEGFLLGPGMLVKLSGFTRVKVRVEPAVALPPTRLGAAPGRFGRVPAAPDGWHLNPEFSPGAIRNQTGADVDLFGWDGDKWVPGALTITAGSRLDLGWYLDTDPARAADLSFDGKFSVNDVVAAGAFGDYAGPLYVSKKLWDANGNAGDNGAAYPALSAPPPTWVAGYGAFDALAPLVATYFARCGLEVWEGCDPGDFRPRLAPYRRVVLNSGDIAVPNEAVTPDGVTAIVVPAFNVEGATLVGRMAAGANPIRVAWVTPWVKDALGTPSKAIAEEAIDFAGAAAAASFQSALSQLNASDLLQVQLKGQGVSTLKNGAVLTLARRFTG
ncbi:MAG: hypothetical protein JWM53_3847 [bacterium]|nr:hypothetical protein [bacterium]